MAKVSVHDMFPSKWLASGLVAMNTTYDQSFIRGRETNDPYLSFYLERQDPQYYIGLDLGQAQDFSALIIVSLTHQVVNDRLEPCCEAPQILRWQLGTGYPEVVGEVSKQLAKAPASTK